MDFNEWWEKQDSDGSCFDDPGGLAERAFNAGQSALLAEVERLEDLVKRQTVSWQRELEEAERQRDEARREAEKEFVETFEHFYGKEPNFFEQEFKHAVITNLRAACEKDAFNNAHKWHGEKGEDHG